MAITNILKSIILDVYDHDNKTPKTIKSIAADNDIRYVAAEIQCEGVRYDVSASSTVELIILRPDKVGVSVVGQPQEFTYETDPVFDTDTGETTPGETITYYGVYAELDQAALAKSGTLLGQFKITNGNQVLRTEIFKINNGRALDAETSDWAGEYQGYDLEEMAADISAMTTATNADVGKYLRAISVENGKVVAWQFSTPSGGGGGGEASVAIDKTLTVENAAADAKAVGDRIRGLFTEKATDNLFNKDVATVGSYINPYTGDVAEYNGVFRELIEFEEGSYTFLAQPGVFGANAYTVAMFDENENFVSYTQGTHTEIDSMSSIVTVTFSSQATATAKYFNINGTTDILNTLMVVKGAQYPNEYVPYGTYKTIDGLQISKSQIIDLDDEANPLKGKIISLNGDSIAAGVGYQGGYGKIIAEENAMTYENIAVGGGTVAYVSADVHCISRTIANMRSDADYVILDGGGNDADSGVPLGTLSTGYDATLDDTTFAGAFENMLKSAIARFPNKKIGYVFVHKCAYLFSSSVENSYYGIAKAACEKWGIPYCDLNTQAPPLNYINSLKTAYTANGDGYHPNEQGYRLFYVPKITAWMKTL